MSFNKRVRRVMARYVGRTSWVVAMALLFASCDSGDIYPEHVEERNDNISVTAEFVLSGTADSENYQLYFGAFEDDNNAPVVWTRVLKSGDKDTVRVSLDNIPPTATSIRLCLLNIGRRAIYDFFSYDISQTDKSMEIPLTEVPLKLKYEKVQDIFVRNCTACHGTETGGAGLLLGEGKSYRYLVNKSSKNSDKMRVEPFSIEKSFLFEVLTSDTLQLKHPHHTIMHSQDDMNLLKAWVERGAEE